MIIPTTFVLLFIQSIDAASFYIEKDIYVPGHKQFYIRTHYPFKGTPVDFIAEMEEDPEDIEYCLFEDSQYNQHQKIRKKAIYYEKLNRVISKLSEPTQWDQEEDEEFCQKYLPEIFKSGSCKVLQPRDLCHRMLYSQQNSKSCSYLDEFEDLLDFKECREKQQQSQQKDPCSFYVSTVNDVSANDISAQKAKARKIEYQNQAQPKKFVLHKAVYAAFVKDDSLARFTRIQYPIGRDENGLMQYELSCFPRNRFFWPKLDNLVTKRMDDYGDLFDNLVLTNEHCLDDTPDPFADFDFDRSQGMELKPADRPVKIDKSTHESSAGYDERSVGYDERSTGYRKSTGHRKSSSDSPKNGRQQNLGGILVSLYEVYIEEPIKSFFGISPAGPADLCMNEDK